jgi:diguanylate cyclase (GGDEF)-like protein/PAS domain S-box-containing protein
VDEGVGALLEELRRSKEMLAAAQQLARIGSWEWDVAANRVTWSDELFRIYGHAPQAFEPSYQTFLDHVHPDDRDGVDARNHKAFADHQPFDDVKRVSRADGSIFLMRTQGEVITDGDGNVARMVGVCEDVTDRVRAEEAQALLASIVRSSNDAIYTLARDGTITSWNPAAERLFGYAESEIVGQPAARLVRGADADEDARRVAVALTAEAVDPFEAIRVRADETQVTVSVALSPIRDAQGSISGLSVIARDVSERRRFEAQVRHLAEHDALTGLCNRRRFEVELERALDRATRYETNGAVLILDLDNFKHVNDDHGHGGGDQVLQSVGALLRGRVRSTDVLARLGGDEFAVLLPQATGEEALGLARSIVTAVRRHSVLLDGEPARVTTSVGVATIGPDTAEAAVLMALADGAMYAAKAAGRDRALLLDPAKAGAGTGKSWQRRIERALAQDGFELYCQPIVDLATGEVARYEALVRLIDKGQVTLPGAFLPAAERLGLIHAIDRWVLGEAVRLLAEHPRLELEVNVSGRSLDDHELLEYVESELASASVDPARLVLEITETATIANMDDARRFAEALSSLGCGFAIDDFGTGFGSFTYLKHLPASYLKIDGDFVASPRSRTDELVIEAIVGMARGLGKATIAEFVGDEQTVEMLRAAGVDYAQGYFVGRPFPARELV